MDETDYDWLISHDDASVSIQYFQDCLMTKPGIAKSDWKEIKEYIQWRTPPLNKGGDVYLIKDLHQQVLQWIDYRESLKNRNYQSSDEERKEFIRGQVFEFARLHIDHLAVTLEICNRALKLRADGPVDWETSDFAMFRHQNGTQPGIHCLLRIAKIYGDGKKLPLFTSERSQMNAIRFLYAASFLPDPYDIRKDDTVEILNLRSKVSTEFSSWEFMDVRPAEMTLDRLEKIKQATAELTDEADETKD